MKNRILATMLAVAVGLALSGNAWAKQGGPKEKKRPGTSAPEQQKGKADKDKDKGARHESGPDSRPAGWDQGKKTGWGDCDAPPGQAKKEGCDDRDHHAKGKDKDRDDDKDKDKVKAKSKSKGTQGQAKSKKKVTGATTTSSTTTAGRTTTAQAAPRTTTTAKAPTTTQKRTTRVKDPETLTPTKVQ